MEVSRAHCFPEAFVCDERCLHVGLRMTGVLIERISTRVLSLVVVKIRVDSIA